MTYAKKDFRIGDILTTKGGRKYILFVDENGEWAGLTTPHKDATPGLFNCIKFNEDGVLFASKNLEKSREVVKVERYMAKDSFDAFTEALKYITGRNVLYGLVIVWTRDEKEERIDDILAQMDRNGITISDVVKYLEK